MMVTAKQRRRAEKKQHRDAKRQLDKLRPVIEAAAQYQAVCAWSLEHGDDQVVCESCGFVQPNVHIEDGHAVFPCLRGPVLGVPCSGEYAVTVETYRDTS